MHIVQPLLQLADVLLPVRVSSLVFKVQGLRCRVEVLRVRVEG